MQLLKILMKLLKTQNRKSMENNVRYVYNTRKKIRVINLSL
jgi:hypothetical protein